MTEFLGDLVTLYATLVVGLGAVMLIVHGCRK